MFRRLALGLLARSLLREVSAIRQALDIHNRLLARIADHFSPEYDEDRETLKADTGVTHLDSIDAGLALDFVEKFRSATGHTPDEDEILIYLADEKTTDLHKRLIERDDELARLVESRRGSPHRRRDVAQSRSDRNLHPGHGRQRRDHQCAVDCRHRARCRPAHS